MVFNSYTHEILVRWIAIIAIVASVLTSLVNTANAVPTKIVVLGDSLVAGYGLAPGEAFPEQLSVLLEKIDIEVEIVNAGVSGDTSTGGLSRLDWSVPVDTDAVILELGANDALRGISPQITKRNLDDIISKLKARGAKVMLVGMKAPPNMGKAYVDQFDAIYQNLAQKHELMFYPFFLDGVVAVTELNQADGIHPTAEGVNLIASRFLPYAQIFIDHVQVEKRKKGN